jgi:pimeloyl-ACP methyl ester carboxylesterase
MTKKHVVFIHGFLENAHMWQHILGKISKQKLHIHTPELAGHGLRQHNDQITSITDYAHDILQQIHIPEDEKVILIGHSMGGYTAIELCKLLGNKVSGLCLLHSTATADSSEKKEARLRAIEAVQQNKALYNRTVIVSLFAEKKREQLRTQIEQSIEDANAMDTNAIVQALHSMRNRADNVAFLKQRSFPLFYFLGTEDSRLPISELQAELELLPGAVASIAENTGHMGHMECTDLVAEFIQRIIRADL